MVKTYSEEEFKDILNRVCATFLPREISLVVFLIAVILLKLAGLISFLKYTNWIILILIFYLTTAFIFRFLVKKQKSASAIINLYFFYDISVELISISLIVYLIGSVEWIGVIFLFFPIVYASIILPKEKAFIGWCLTSLSYALLAFLPYFDVIPFIPYFPLQIPLHKNLNYIVNNVLLATFTFFLIGLAAHIFIDTIKKRGVELKKQRKH